MVKKSLQRIKIKIATIMLVVVAQLPKCIVSHEISFQFSLIVQIQQDCNRSDHIATDHTTF